MKILENSTTLCPAYLRILEVLKLTGLVISRHAGEKVVKIVIVTGEKKMKHVACN